MTQVPQYDRSYNNRPSNIENTIIAEDVSRMKRSWLRRKLTTAISTLAFLFTLGGAVVACNGYNPDTRDRSNPLLPIDTSLVQPENGSIVSIADSPLEVGVVTPGANPLYQGIKPTSVDVEITATGDNAAPGSAEDDWTATIVDQSEVSLETYVSETLNLLTANNGRELKDGEKVTIEYTITATEAPEPNERRAVVEVTYDFDERPRIRGCYVDAANVGRNLLIYCSAIDPSSGNLLRDNWSLTKTDLEGAVMDGRAIVTSRILESSDVGLYTYTVTASNDSLTSEPYTFIVSVNERKSYLTIHCTVEDTNYIADLLLPESSVDAVSEACFPGYDSGQKPSSATHPNNPYFSDVDPVCAETAIAGLPAAEREIHKNYNEGMTPEYVFTNCTVSSVQVRYWHD